MLDQLLAIAFALKLTVQRVNDSGKARVLKEIPAEDGSNNLL